MDGHVDGDQKVGGDDTGGESSALGQHRGDDWHTRASRLRSSRFLAASASIFGRGHNCASAVKIVDENPIFPF